MPRHMDHDDEHKSTNVEELLEDSKSEAEEEVTPPSDVAEAEDVPGGVFSSSTLDDIKSGDNHLVGAVPMKRSLACEGFGDWSESISQTYSEQLDRREETEGITAGLGQKKKAEIKMRMKGRMMGMDDISSNRAKTLAEKRSKLREDILKYGVAAIEKLYPRQGRKSAGSAKKSPGPKNLTFRLKPAPHDGSSQEVEAWKILKPYSHGKYIKQPDVSKVVYIQRKSGLVPLSSLCKQSKTVISNNIRLLRRRNVTLGKPEHFVRDGDRLVGVGGTRNKTHLNVRIHTLPTFQKKKEQISPFLVDDELAKFAASAIKNVSSGKVDIRELKRKQLLDMTEASRKIASEKSLVDRMLMKISFKREDNEDQDFFDSCMNNYKETRDAKKKSEKIEEKSDLNSTFDEYKSFNLGLKDKDYYKEEEDQDDEPNYSEEVVKEESEEIEEEKTSTEESVKKNAWSEVPKNVGPKDLNYDECPPLHGYYEGSIRSLVPKPVKLNFDGYTGYDFCDVPDCFCKENDSKLDDSRTSLPTEVGTPSDAKSGSQTPSGSKHKTQRIAKDLQRVKRALKTLGVNVIEYEEDDELGECMKDYCKLGCICDSLRTKQIAPLHCGKVDCMFSCCCSKEALKWVEGRCGSRRVNISAAVGERIMEDTQRGMAAEERKFSNTVVVTADKNTVMLGGRGSRRERKVPQRYKNEHTLMLDFAGKDYVQKEESSESEEESEEENSVDQYDKLRQDLIPCTVIVPLVNLPKNTNIWCLYHAQYSCPCSKYKNPLDFAPDIETGARGFHGQNIQNEKEGPDLKRKMKASEEKQRMAGQSKKKKASTEEPLLGIEDVDPDFKAKSRSAPVPSSVRHPVSTQAQAARTKPLTKKQTVRAPANLTKRRSVKNPKIPDLVNLVGDDDEEDNDLEVSDQLSFDLSPAGSCQYVRWDILKEKYQNGHIDFFFWVRPGRGRNMLFLTKSGERPYIATAVNLRNLQGSTQNLPSLVSDAVGGVRERDKGRYCVLQFNRTVWTVNSLKAIKGQKDLGLSLETEMKTEREIKREVDKTPATKDGSIKINLNEPVQKLPIGQSLITVVEGPNQKAIMQVKLPPTLSAQYWSLISVGEGQSSIQCPDSSLGLKCAILQQAATLSTATSTTVRIPIPVSDQDPSFGVYAVPGLKTHVFVGPFAGQKTEAVPEEDDDIVCLDDEEVKIVEPNKNEPESEETVDQKEETKSKEFSQIPLVIENVDSAEDVDVGEEAEDIDQESPDQTQARALQSLVSTSSPADISDSQSSYGRVVLRQTKRRESKESSVEIKYKLPDGGDGTYSALVEARGKVLLVHPQYPDHEVICPDTQSASLWLEEYSASQQQEEDMFEDPPPLPSEPPKVRSPPPILKKITAPFLSTGKSTNKMALYVQLKQQKDEAQLFYELGHTAFKKFFNKNVTRAQILLKAREEIKRLQDEGNVIEKKKQEQMRRRSKLFELFTKSLNGLPITRKKAAVIELKELLKKDKEWKARQKLQDEEVEIVKKVKAKPKAGVVRAGPEEVPRVSREELAFNTWVDRRRPELIAQGLTSEQVNKSLAESWVSLSEEEKSRVVSEAERTAGHLKQEPTPVELSEQKEVIEAESQPNQPPVHIQVPRPLSKLRTSQTPVKSNQSVLLPTRTSRPTPDLIPVSSTSFSPPGEAVPAKQTQFEILNVPSRPSISGLGRERRESVEIIQTSTPTHLTVRDQQDLGLIQIGGESFLIPHQAGEIQQNIVLSPEDAQQLLLAQQQEQEQVILSQDQPVFVDEQGRQVLLGPEQQLQLLQQLQGTENTNQIQLMQIEPDQQEMVQLEGVNGERVVLAFPDHSDLLYRAQEEGVDL